MEASVVVPDCMRAAVENYRWIQASDGQSGARVYRLDQGQPPDLYLKWGAESVADALAAEVVRLRWLARRLPAPEIQQFCYSGNEAWLLTTAVPGRTARECLLSDPHARPEIVRTLAKFLREFHSLPVAECPFQSGHLLRMADAKRNLKLGQVNELDFNPEHEGWSAEAVWIELQNLAPPPAFDSVVTHGDFSLDNVFLQSGRVTGCIDAGWLGAADPYQDLAVLWRDLGDFGGDLQTTLFETYGIADPDERRMRYHLCLDEFF